MTSLPPTIVDIAAWMTSHTNESLGVSRGASVGSDTLSTQSDVEPNWADLSDLARVCLRSSINHPTRSIPYLDRPNDRFDTSSREILIGTPSSPSLPLFQPTFTIPSRGHYLRPRSIDGRLEISMACHYPVSHQTVAHYPANHQTTSSYFVDCQGTAYYPTLSYVRRWPTTLLSIRWQHAILSATSTTTQLSYKLVKGTPA